MGQYRRVGHGQNPYMDVGQVRADLGVDAEEAPAAMELLAQVFTAMQDNATPIRATLTLARRSGALGVGGRWPDGHDRMLTVEHAQGYDHCGDHPGPLSLAQVCDLIDPRDSDCAALVQVLRALYAVEPQTVVETLAEGYPAAVVSTPDGDRFTLTTADQ